MTWLSVADAAKELGLAKSAVYLLVSSKQLACYRVGPSGGRIRFRREDLDAYLEGTRRGPRPKAAARRHPVPKYDHGF